MKNFLDFTFRPDTDFCVNDNYHRVYNSQKRIIGYVFSPKMPLMRDTGELKYFDPVLDWKTKFSPNLINRLNLS